MKYNRALIIGGFPLSEKERAAILNEQKSDETCYIAVDGGLLQYMLMNQVPDLVIGDMDSVRESALFWYFKQKSACILLNKDKDFLDIEAAIDYLIASGISAATIFGVTGGRMDQTFACIPILKKATLEDIDLNIISGNEMIGLMEGKAEKVFQNRIGDTWSFIAIGEDVKGLSLDGFRFGLKDRDLKNMETLALSNISVSDNVSVKIDKGTLMYFNRTGRRDDVE